MYQEHIFERASWWLYTNYNIQQATLIYTSLQSKLIFEHLFTSYESQAVRNSVRTDLFFYLFSYYQQLSIIIHRVEVLQQSYTHRNMTIHCNGLNRQFTVKKNWPKEIVITISLNHFFLTLNNFLLNSDVH